MDGYLTIGTEIDDSGLDRDIAILEKKIQTTENEQSNLALSMQPYKEELEKISVKMDEVNAEADRLRQITKNYDLSSLSAEEMQAYAKFKDLVNESDRLSNSYAEINSKLSTQQAKYDKLTIKVDEYKNKVDDINFKRVSQEIKNAETNQVGLNYVTSEMGSHVSNAISKVGKLAIAVMGVYTAYNFVSSAANTVAQYDTQLATDMEYINYALAMTLKPVIETIVNLVYKVLTYVNAIAQAWFGVNLFANASASSFASAKSSSSDISSNTATTTKNLEKQKKLLSGIDEITNLEQDTSTDTSDTGTGDTGTSGTGVTMPSYDLSGGDMEVPSWLQWILDHGSTVVGIVGAIAGAFVAWKLGLSGWKSLGIALFIYEVIQVINDLIELIKDPSWDKFGKLLEDLGLAFVALGAVIGGDFGLKFAGIGLVITGVGVIIQGVIDYLKDPSWENFITILGGIALIAVGLGVAFSPVVGVIAAIILLIAAIALAVYTHWDEVKEVLGAVWDWIYTNIIEPIGNGIQAMVETIKSIFWGLVSILQAIFTTVINIIANPFIVARDTIKGVINGITGYFKNMVSGIKKLLSGDLTGALNSFKSAFKSLANGLWSIIKAPLNLIIGGVNSLIKGINKIKFDVPSWVPGIGGKTLGFNIKTIPKLARGAVVNAPTQAIIGEAGKEAVLPLQNNTEWMDTLADKVNGGGSTIELLIELINAVNSLADNPPKFYIDKKEFAKATYSAYQEEGRRLGQSNIIRRS